VEGFLNITPSKWKQHAIACACIFIFAFVIRSYRSAWPAQAVFDEAWYAASANAYAHGEFSFDLHPPFGRMVLGSVIPPDQSPVLPSMLNAQAEYPPGFPFIRIRQWVVLWGACLAVVLYGIAVLLSGRIAAGILAGGMATIDNALVFYSRTILPETFLITLGMAGLLCVLASTRVRPGWRLWVLAAGIALASTSANVKVTGLAFIFTACIAWIAGHPPKRLTLRWMMEASLFIIIPIVVAIAIHIAYFSHASHTDRYGWAQMFSPGFQATLEGNSNVGNISPNPMLSRIIEYTRRSVEGQAQIGESVWSGSAWYTWPLLLRPYYGWNILPPLGSPNTGAMHIVILGNPIVWWGSTLGIVLFIVIGWKLLPRSTYAILAGGYLAALLPHALIPRGMYIYHYLPALVLAIPATAVLFVRTVKPIWEQRLILTYLLVLAGTFFVYFSPLTYGWPLSHQEINARLWLTSWQP
jgi:dolichyl-phosphate-mannose--protein O-mannosyl transferase